MKNSTSIITVIALTAATCSSARSAAFGTSSQGYSFRASGTYVTTAQEEEKTPVKLEDLPADVKKSLQGADYKDWTIVMVWWIREGKSPYYEIELIKKEEQKVVKLNEKGIRII